MEEKRETNNIIIGRNTVKEAIRSGSDLTGLVPEAVERICRREQLYKD